MGNIGTLTGKPVKTSAPERTASPSILTSYLQLTKPSIMLLVLITGATSLVMEGSFLSQPLKFLLVLIALYLTGGCANALNQYFEREIDARMTRTRDRRPLPSGRVGASEALIFSVSIGTIGVLIFGLIFNWLTAALSLGTILFYSLFYTLWLKPNTPQNIVIGGIAGAMAPVGAWTAATGEMAFAPWTVFLIVFLWTPPHFWSLALFCKEDYREVGYPMLPNVKGDESTLNQILGYSIVLVLASFLPMFTGASWIYGTVAAIFGILLLNKAIMARRCREIRSFKRFFGFSILYLFTLCIAMMIDAMLL